MYTGGGQGDAESLCKGWRQGRDGAWSETDEFVGEGWVEKGSGATDSGGGAKEVGCNSSEGWVGHGNEISCVFDGESSDSKHIIDDGTAERQSQNF